MKKISKFFKLFLENMTMSIALFYGLLVPVLFTVICSELLYFVLVEIMNYYGIEILFGIRVEPLEVYINVTVQVLIFIAIVIEAIYHTNTQVKNKEI